MWEIYHSLRRPISFILKTDTYTKIGNTVYCIFDDFGSIDSEAWTAFYKGSGPMPKYNPQFKGDICGIVEALDKAAGRKK